MQLYKLISLSAAGCSVRKAESHLGFLISGWCDTRHHLWLVKTPRCGGCSQHGEVRGGLVFGLWSSSGPSRLKDPLVPGYPDPCLTFPCRPKASWSSPSCLVGITRCGLLAPSLPCPSRACSCMWGWAELCDETRNCSNREKKIRKLNIYTENGIFLWFLGVCSVPGTSDPGLGFFVSMSQFGFSFTFLLLCFESKKQKKKFKEYISLYVALPFVHSSLSPSQPKQIQCHTSAVLWGLKADEKLHQPGYNLFNSSSLWRNVFCWPEECGWKHESSPAWDSSWQWRWWVGQCLKSLLNSHS